MEGINYTLLSDGSSDTVLMPVLTWLLKKYFPKTSINSQRANLAILRERAKTLPEKIIKSCELYSCNLLFIHRDAEKETLENRKKEIEKAIGKIPKTTKLPKTILVIPIKMQEAWLILDSEAIKKAVGNPSSKVQLILPKVKQLETLEDPKKKLERLMIEASESKGRRLKRLKRDLSYNFHLVAQNLSENEEHFEKLLELTAFKHLEKQVKDLSETCAF